MDDFDKGARLLYIMLFLIAGFMFGDILFGTIENRRGIIIDKYAVKNSGLPQHGGSHNDWIIKLDNEKKPLKFLERDFDKLKIGDTLEYSILVGFFTRPHIYHAPDIIEIKPHRKKTKP